MEEKALHNAEIIYQLQRLQQMEPEIAREATNHKHHIHQQTRSERSQSRCRGLCGALCLSTTHALDASTNGRSIKDLA